MKAKRASVIFFGILSFVLLVLLDQITKKLAVLHLKDQQPIVLIQNVFQLFYLENRGAAFGILQGKRSIFMVITIVIFFLLAYCFVRMPYIKKFFRLRIVIVLIAAGAAGNFIDRTAQGYVVDFFYFNLINFPIFNVADIYVTCAAIFLVIFILFIYKEQDLTELLQSLKISKKDSKKEQ